MSYAFNFPLYMYSHQFNSNYVGKDEYEQYDLIKLATRWYMYKMQLFSYMIKSSDIDQHYIIMMLFIVQ